MYCLHASQHCLLVSDLFLGLTISTTSKQLQETTHVGHIFTARFLLDANRHRIPAFSSKLGQQFLIGFFETKGRTYRSDRSRLSSIPLVLSVYPAPGLNSLLIVSNRTVFLFHYSHSKIRKHDCRPDYRTLFSLDNTSGCLVSVEILDANDARLSGDGRRRRSTGC